MDFMTSALIASWVAILLLALVVSGLVRQVHQLSRGATSPVRTAAPLGPAPGSAAPEAAELLGPQAQRDGGVLLFLSANCRTCTGVLAEARKAAGSEDGPALAALYAGPAPEDAAREDHAREDGSAPGTTVPVHAGRDDLFATYDAVATPFAVAVDGAGRVLRAVPLGSVAALSELLDETFPRRLRSAR